MAFHDGFGDEPYSIMSCFSPSGAEDTDSDTVGEPDDPVITEVPVSEKDEWVEVDTLDGGCHIQVRIVAGKNFPRPTKDSRFDPYVRVLAGRFRATTSTKRDSVNPIWNESLAIQLPPDDHSAYMTVEVWDSDYLSSDRCIGAIIIPLCTSEHIVYSKWFPLGRTNEMPRQQELHGELHLDVEIHNPNAIPPTTLDKFRQFCNRRGFNLPVVTNTKTTSTIESPPGRFTDYTSESEDARIHSSDFEDIGQEDCNSSASSRSEVLVLQNSSQGQQKPAKLDNSLPQTSNQIEKSLKANLHQPQPASLEAVSNKLNEAKVEKEFGNDLQKADSRLFNSSTPASLDEATQTDSDREGGDTDVASNRSLNVSSSGKPSPNRVPPNSYQLGLALLDSQLKSIPGAHKPLGPSPLTSGQMSPSQDCSDAESEGYVQRQQVTSVPACVEVVELIIPSVIVASYAHRAVSSVVLTDFRLVVMCEQQDVNQTPMSPTPSNDTGDFDETMKLGTRADLSTYVPLGMISEVTLQEQKGSHIMHRSNSMSGDISCSNSSNSLPLLSKLGGSRHASAGGLTQLVVRTRDFRALTITFTGRDDVRDNIRALYTRLHYFLENIDRRPPAYNLGCLNSKDWGQYNTEADYKRQGIDQDKDGLMSSWRVCDVNAHYRVCPTYPRIWYVPRCIDDETILECAKFRSKGRLPALSYYHQRTGTALVRCAQPLVGASGRRCESDEFVLRAVRNASPHPDLLVIIDARSSLAGMGNKLMGKGSEIANTILIQRYCSWRFKIYMQSDPVLMLSRLYVKNSLIKNGTQS
eukprot:m.171162 g.171162  ORF g.171162 m.171162 type:complete len:806 (+) comp15347_c0_seq3:491-2908(+)